MGKFERRRKRYKSFKCDSSLEKNLKKRNMASTDNIGTLSFLAKITTFLVALFCWFYVVTSSILLVTGRFEHDHYWIWMPIILMAYFVLEFVGIRSKIPRLIIFSCVIWTYITWYSIRTLIDVY